MLYRCVGIGFMQKISQKSNQKQPTDMNDQNDNSTTGLLDHNCARSECNYSTNNTRLRKTTDNNKQTMSCFGS